MNGELENQRGGSKTGEATHQRLARGVHTDASSLFVDACRAIVDAIDAHDLAAATLEGLRALGVDAVALAWAEGDAYQVEPPALEPAVLEWFALQASSGGTALIGKLQLLGQDAYGSRLVATPALPNLSGKLLELADLRLTRLRKIHHLQAAVEELARAERLQRALFAIADLAGSERPMPSLLQGLHEIIGELMYARNFYIALYNHHRDTLRFIYMADEMDSALYDPDLEIPATDLANSITLALIRHGRAVRGSYSNVAETLNLQGDAPVGTPSVDFMGVPMHRGHQVVGVLAVQSYHLGIGYSEADHAVLSFVAEHVLTALERKRSQEDLERRVIERTRELAAANRKLQDEMAERERAAHLQATLFRIAALVQREGSDGEFYQSVHDAVGELIDAENFYIALLSEDRSRLDFVYVDDTSEEPFASRLLGRGLSEHVMRTGQTLLANAETCRILVERGEVDPVDIGVPAQWWLGAPLLGPRGVMGVVAVQSYTAERSYANEDADLLTFVSYQIANSLERRRQAEALQTMNVHIEQRVDERTRELRQQIEVREQIEVQLKHQVMHDPLTGLPNRLAARESIERTLADQAGEGARGFAVLYLDVDRFKLFNDSFGHLVGDAVLREVARRLKDCVREPRDTVARLSGDEFAILLRDCPLPATACQVAERVQKRMRAPMLLDGRELRVSLSIGIALGGQGYRDVDSLLHDADTALYQAKAAGRQRYVVFRATADTSSTNVLDVEAQLRQALTQGELRAHFQPIARLTDGVTVGYEALIRWQHPERGLLGPGQFLSIAKQTGLLEEIDWHMYRLACKAGAELVRDGGFIDINISPSHFQYEDFAERLLALLDEVGFNPRQLRIELTEGTLLRDPDAVARILERLAEAGVEAALDDFGTGYSSLGYLHRFPLRMLKVDRSFIDSLDDPKQGRASAIVAAVLKLADALGLETIAEGVETPAQRDALLELGYRYAQGFHFSRARPASHWLGTNQAAPAQPEDDP